jgi:hypothetical protein
MREEMQPQEMTTLWRAVRVYERVECRRVHEAVLDLDWADAVRREQDAR